MDSLKNLIYNTVWFISITIVCLVSIGLLAQLYDRSGLKARLKQQRANVLPQDDPDDNTPTSEQRRSIRRRDTGDDDRWEFGGTSSRHLKPLFEEDELEDKPSSSFSMTTSGSALNEGRDRASSESEFKRTILHSNSATDFSPKNKLKIRRERSSSDKNVQDVGRNASLPANVEGRELQYQQQAAMPIRMRKGMLQYIQKSFSAGATITGQSTSDARSKNVDMVETDKIETSKMASPRHQNPKEALIASQKTTNISRRCRFCHACVTFFEIIFAMVFFGIGVYYLYSPDGFDLFDVLKKTNQISASASFHNVPANIYGIAFVLVASGFALFRKRTIKIDHRPGPSQPFTPRSVQNTDHDESNGNLTSHSSLSSSVLGAAVCGSNRENDLVDALAWKLERFGFETFRGDPNGQEFPSPSLVKDAIKRSAVFLIFVTNDDFTRPQVYDEIACARDCGAHVMVVCAEGCSIHDARIPPSFRKLVEMCTLTFENNGLIVPLTLKSKMQNLKDEEESLLSETLRVVNEHVRSENNKRRNQVIWDVFLCHFRGNNGGGHGVVQQQHPHGTFVDDRSLTEALAYVVSWVGNDPETNAAAQSIIEAFSRTMLVDESSASTMLAVLKAKEATPARASREASREVIREVSREVGAAEAAEAAAKLSEEDERSFIERSEDDDNTSSDSEHQERKDGKKLSDVVGTGKYRDETAESIVTRKRW